MLYHWAAEKVGERIGRRHGWMAQRRFHVRANLAYAIILLGFVPAATLIAAGTVLVRWLLGYAD